MFQSTVTQVIDGDTFDISPGWRWRNQEGSRIRIANYDAPELHAPGGSAAKSGLERLILRQTVSIGDGYTVDRGRLVCDVFVNGSSLRDSLS